jgi:hypothetical protein
MSSHYEIHHNPMHKAVTAPAKPKDDIQHENAEIPKDQQHVKDPRRGVLGTLDPVSQKIKEGGDADLAAEVGQKQANHA